MFEVGWSELMVIAVVAIVVIGPKDLPRVMRLVGQWTGKMKRMAREFQGQFNEALREAELEDVRKDVVAIGKNVSESVAKAGADIGKSIQAPDAAAAPAATIAPVAAVPAPAAPPIETAAAPSPEPAAAADADEIKP